MARALQGTAVLVVEDDADTLELLELGLSAVGAEVRTAPSAEAALALLESWRPDVILSDLELPGIDGYTLLEMLRANPRLRTIPAVALSGVLDKPRERATGVSFEKLMSKPSKLPEIVLALAALATKAAGSEAATDQPGAQLRAVLEELNRASGCRYTSVLVFGESNTLRSLWTFDRDRPKHDPFPLGLPVHASYCVLVRDAREMCVVEDATTDPRTARHAKRHELARYIGAPLFRPDGTMFGTVCCYDAAPRPIGQETRDALAGATRHIEAWLAELIDPR